MKKTLKLLLGGKNPNASTSTKTPLITKNMEDTSLILPSQSKLKKGKRSTKKSKHKTTESSIIHKNFNNFITEYDNQFENIEKVKRRLKSDEEIFNLMYLKKLI